MESYDPPGDLTTRYEIGASAQTIYYTFSQYPCTYGATYTAELLRKGDDLDNMESTSDNVPSFIVQAAHDGQLRIYSNDREDEGFYVVRVSTVLDNLALLENVNGLFTVAIDPQNPPSNLIYSASFEITIEMVDPIGALNSNGDNTRPFFIPEPTDLNAYIGETFEHSFGDAMDYEGHTITVQVDLGDASSLGAVYDFDTNTITIPEGRTDESSIPISEIVITLTDDYSDELFGDNPGVTTYTITLHLTERGSQEDSPDDPYWTYVKDK